ncbi:MAG: type II toxin-antitoxin system PemK/MazF family toxin [Parachlamydiales bacterium]|nr:type II toxin-antitoxin system PemK/MazF family toxin [Parachlamydiales bacterium]
MNKPTRTFELYDVVKVPFPFTDIHAEKVRPAVVISTAKYFNAKTGSSILAMITSLKPDRYLWPSDIQIADLKTAGLPAPSIIRFKIFTLDHRLIFQKLGFLSEADQRNFKNELKSILNF